MPQVKLNEKSLSEEATEVSLRDRFLKKKRRESEETIQFDGEEVTIKLRAISSAELDRLVGEHTPRKNKQRDTSFGFNSDTFPPALVSRVVINPEMSEEEWREVWANPEWSTGELAHLFDLAFRICNTGFDLPTTGRG